MKTNTQKQAIVMDDLEEEVHSVYDSLILYVDVEKINLDVECEYDLMVKRGIRLKSRESFGKKNEKIYDGLQSEFFGTDFGSTAAFAERYHCKCGKYVGKMYNGHRCEVCGEEVVAHDTDLSKTGWIILDHFKVMSPIYEMKLLEALGKSEGKPVLHKILKVEHPDEIGSSVLSEKDQLKLEAERKKHPFIGKGMTWLWQNIDEVIAYYLDKSWIKGLKRRLFIELQRDVDNMFTSCIPVYSALLRTELPGEKGSKIFKLKTNVCYTTIIRIANFINDIPFDELTERKQITIDNQLRVIQARLETVFNVTYKEATGKKGIMLSKVVGGRYNASARNIIIPSSGKYRCNEVGLGYITFMELFRYEICNLYSKVKQCTIAETNAAWKKALTHFDPLFYSIMEHMVKDPESRKHLRLLICRNPCINYLSFICMYVVEVFRDMEDKVLAIPSHVLTVMNADFDGDQVGIFRIYGDYLSKQIAKCFDPRYNLYISRINGRVDPAAMPIKDELIAFYQFNAM